MFKIDFETDNEAFADDAGTEIARILELVAGQISKGRTSGNVWDFNGNIVGTWEHS